ncbi:ABC transporter permease [Chryseolinea sp. T2]|uniref:ABC transporter permease n=1 Tax=Chryseolinea sp. T2 TaxID=3129255 RepID=UPI003077D28F
MIFHNVKVAFRSMRRDNLFAAINIAGLSIGITTTLLILAWVQYEYSYNHFIANYREIYQVKINFDHDGSISTESNSPLPLYSELQNSDSRIKDVCFTSNCYGHSLRYKDKKAYKEVLAVSHEFLEMFNIPLVKGEFNSLDDPYSIMINESTAREFFGDVDPIGQFIVYDNVAELKVTGIFKDVPHNSSFWFMALVPTSYDQKWLTEDNDKWDSFYPTMYMRLRDPSRAMEVSEHMRGMITRHFDDGTHPTPFLYPLDRQHLYNEFENGVEAGGRIWYVKLFSGIAVIVLLIACINYINLSTARSERRAREVGIRKAIGSVRAQLVRQFMTESMISTLIALVIALVAFELALPWYNTLVGARVALDLGTWEFWFIVLSVFAITAFLSGFYPAFFFSMQKPIDVLRGVKSSGVKTSLPRKVLVTLQFGVAIFLVIGVLVIYQQIEHGLKRNLGYDQNNLIVFAVNDQMEERYNVIKDELLKTGVVENVTKSNEGVEVDYFTDYVDWDNKKTTGKVLFSRVSTDADFVSTMRLKLIAGRDFLPLLKSDTASVLINETAARIMGFRDPIGERIKTKDGDLTIIGIFQDIVKGSPFDQIRPCYIGMLGDGSNHLTIRLASQDNTMGSIKVVEEVFRKLDPLNHPEWWILSDSWKYNYKNINAVGSLARVFASLAVFLTCLGIVGLAAYTAEQRKKEIAIRKILGATLRSVLIMLSNYFVRAALLALLVASPLAWLTMDSYLYRFPYRIAVPWWIIPVTAASILSVTILILLLQTFRVASANPVSGLRSE